MQLYSEGKNYKLYNGSMLDMLEVVEPCSIDSIVTDPPYELNFMGKGWDNSGIAFQKLTWEKCYEALKPGGYLLAFGGSRTFHRIACAIEDAGFEIRDTIMWIYGSGFPKSMNIGLAIDKKNGVKSEIIGVKHGGVFKNHGDNGKAFTFDTENSTGDVTLYKAQNEWAGWGTALKPAFEPIIVARKPCEGSCVDNVLKYGVGGINIDECRIGTEQRTYKGMSSHKPEGAGTFRDDNWEPKDIEVLVSGRFPANVILTYDETDFDEVCGGFPTRETKNGSINNPNLKNSLGNNGIYGKYSDTQPLWEAYNDSGSASRYFYCAKASKKDRDEGLDGFVEKTTGELQGGRKEGSAGSVMNPLRPDGHIRTNPLNPYAGSGGVKKNTHPTVKPTELMQYLIRLVTPNGGTVLDPFNGSGSTGKACMYENREKNKNYNYIGIELTEEYLPISLARIGFACTGEIAEVPDNSPVIKEEKNIPRKEVLW